MKKISKYIPSIIFAIIEIIIVVVILDDATYSSNSDIMAGLVLLYASIRSFAIGLGMSIDKLVLGLAKDLTDIKERIREDFDIEDEREKIKKGTKAVEKLEIKMIIRGIGVGIIYLIALASLLG